MLRVIACPHCGDLIETDLPPGRAVRCPYCDRRFAAPHGSIDPATARARQAGGGARFLIPLGYVVFVLVPMAAVIWLGVHLFGEKTERDPAPPEPVARRPGPPVVRPPTLPPVPGNVRPPRPVQPDGPTHAPDPERSEIPEAPDASAATQPATAPVPRPARGEPDPVAAEVTSPDVVENVEVAVAPLPRPGRPVLAVPAGYTSKWKKLDSVEVRVAGAAVERVPITDGDGRGGLSPVAVLAIYIEVRGDPDGKAVELRRWQDALGEYCSLVTPGGLPVGRANLGPGAGLRTGLPYKQAVRTDGTSVFELVIFAAPPDGLGDLILRLDADRAGATGEFRFVIPASAYKK